MEESEKNQKKLVGATRVRSSRIGARSQNQRRMCMEEPEKRPEKAGWGCSRAKKANLRQIAKPKANACGGARKSIRDGWSGQLTRGGTR